MDKELYDLLDNMTAEELMSAGEMLEELAENTALPEETSSRIRASVLRKAGFEMKNTIRMNKGNDHRNITDSGELNTVRRGSHIIAACAAFAIVAAAAGAVIFGGKLDTEPQKPMSQTSLDSSGSDSTEQKNVPEVYAAERKVQDWAKPYLEQNSETVGYLRIAGIKNGEDLETPVVQHDDNGFYFSHGFDMNENEEGIAYADCNVPIDENGQPSNIILYGTNMRKYTDKGFTSLLQYRDSEEFFKEHSVIDFSTVYDEPDTRYQIFACFIIDMDEEYTSEDTPNPDFFDYWRYRNFDEEHSFDRWIKEINERAIYKTDIECTEDDDYLTLSMTNEANERFALVAKKITHNGGEQTDDSHEKSEDGIFVPDVTGLNSEEAAAQLTEAGFVPVIKEGYFGEPVGKTVGTLPKAGQKLEKGFEVECHISHGEQDCESFTTSVYGKRENEAVQIIKELKLVPERVEVFSGIIPEGSVCDFLNGSRYDSMMVPENTVKYYVSGSSETTADIPDFHKVVYEDDDIVITADKLLCDGNYFIMHLNEETKDGRPISEFHEKWDELLSCDGEEWVAFTEHYLSDATSSGAFLACPGNFTENGSELTLNVVARKDLKTPKSDCSMSFTIKPDLSTRTFTSEGGHTLTLSPMGITWSKDMNANSVLDDPLESSQDTYSDIILITKDGKRIKLIDYYLSERFGSNEEGKKACCFYAYKDIDEIAAVEMCGIIHR